MLTFIYVWCIIILVRNKKTKHQARMKEKTKMRRTTTLEKEYGVKIVKDWKMVQNSSIKCIQLMDAYGKMD